MSYGGDISVALKIDNQGLFSRRLTGEHGAQCFVSKNQETRFLSETQQRQTLPIS